MFPRIPLVCSVRRRDPSSPQYFILFQFFFPFRFPRRGRRRVFFPRHPTGLAPSRRYVRSSAPASPETRVFPAHYRKGFSSRCYHYYRRRRRRRRSHDGRRRRTTPLSSSDRQYSIAPPRPPRTVDPRYRHRGIAVPRVGEFRARNIFRGRPRRRRGRARR